MISIKQKESKVIEAYGPTGLSAQNQDAFSSGRNSIMNYLDIALAAPMGINNLVTPGLQPWLQNYYDSLKGKK